MIDIKKKDGTVKLSVEFSDSSLYRKELMVEEYVMLNFSTDTIVRFSKGDYIETEFGKFDVVTINRPKQNRTTGGYDYGQRFDGFVEKLKTRMLFYDRQNNKECTWKLTHTPSAFLDIVCSNIKALGWGEYAYSVDASLTEMKNINFDSTSIFDALTAIAEAWGIEWWIDDDLTIHLSKCEHGEPVILSLDNEVVDMDRSEGSSRYATRLYAFGSTRNIPTNYRGASAGTVVHGVVEKRLKLPAGIDYVDAWPNMDEEEVVEAVVNFDEIYPKRIGTISEITTKQYTESVENTDGNSTTETWNAYRFKDGGITFSKDYIIPGQELRVVFQTGVLAGMDFAISFEPNTDGGSGTGTQIYELVRNDEYGINLPNDTLKPQVGDTYVLYGFDIALLANTYLPAAEQEVLAAARLHLQKVCVENATFTCNTNPIKCAGYVENARGELVYAAANIIDLGVGQKVTLINENQFANEGFGSRIFAIEKLLCDKFSCKYSIGGTAKYSRLSDIEGKVSDANDSANENKEEIRSSKKKLIDFANRKFRDIQETTKLLEKSLLNFSGSINPISVKAMQLLVGDESLQFRFVNSKTAPQPIAHSVSFNHSTKRLFAVTGILQHLTIGIKTISPSHAASEYRYWNVADFTSPYIADGTKPFYLYAEVDKIEETGVFVLSEVPIGMDEISGKYYLLVGILNSEFEGERSFVTLYGYSEILPGRITTEKIVSPSGNTYFDFVNEVIQGKITFRSGSAGLYNLVEWKDEDARITTAQTSASEAKEGVVSAKDAIASNLGYENYSDFYNKAVLEGNTILEGGRLRNNIVDTDALFAKEITAKNMIVTGGKVGDFDIASKLIGHGYTNGILNGNSVMLDPSNNEMVMAKNGVKKVRLTSSSLTPLAELKSDGGTIYCPLGSAVPVKKGSSLALFASRDDIGVGGNGLSRSNAVGIISLIPVVDNSIASGMKFTLKPAFYSIDLPYAVNIVHSGDQTDGRFNRITGSNICNVTLRLMNSTGVVSTITDSFTMSVDSGDSGNSYAFNRMARFNFSVPSLGAYWVETSFTIIGSANPIKYQSYNHATTFRHSWWSTNNDWDVQYELTVNPGMSVDGSIGLTELSSTGIQSVWTDHRFIRIDGNTGNDVFIESEGTWKHNGVIVKFDSATITGYIDPTKFASRNYIDDGFYTKVASDGRYLANTAQAADSAKLGGVSAMDYIKYSANYSIAYNNFAIGQSGGRNFIQSHASQPLDLNPLGNAVTINNNVAYHAGNLNRSDTDFHGRTIVGHECFVAKNTDETNNLFIGAADKGIGGTGDKRALLYSYSGDILLFPNGIHGATINATTSNFKSNLLANNGNQVWDASHFNKDYLIRGDSNSGVNYYSNYADANLIWKSGFYELLNGANCPFTDWTWLINSSHSSDSANYRYGLQIAGSNSTTRLAFRNKGELGVGVWSEVYHTNNLNRSDTDFIARNITASGNVDLTGVDSNLFVGRTTGVTPNKYATRLKLGTAIHTGSDAWYFGVDDNDDGSYLRIGYDTTNSAIRFRHDKTAFFGGDIKSWGATGAGFTAQGWQIDNAGNANLKSLTVRELTRFYELEINKIRATNGALAVTDAAVIDNDPYLYQTGSANFSFKDVCPFVAGDLVRCQQWTGSNIKAYTARVTLVAPDGLSLNMDMVTGVNTDVKKGDTIVRWNSTVASRKGLLYLTSSDTGSPNMQVLYDEQVKAQFGNLEGRVWNGAALPANTWGLWAENAYLSGAINATSGKIAEFSIVGSRLYSGNTYGNGSGIEMLKLGTGGRFMAHKDNANYAMLYNYDGGWGLLGVNNDSILFQLGSTNRIANWSFNTTSLDSPTINRKLLTLHSTNGLGCYDLDYGWRNQLRPDGGGLLASGAITWNADGSNVTFAEHVKMQWRADTSKNLMGTSKWKIGANPNTNVFDAGSSSANGNTNTYVYGGLDSSRNVVCLFGTGDNASGGNAGWNSLIPNMDSQYTYRYSVWVYTTATTGSIYHGCDGNGYVCSLGGTMDTNPYGMYPACGTIKDGWKLLTFYVHAKSYTGATKTETGVYSTDGTKIAGGTDWKWYVDSRSFSANWRTYLYYASNGSAYFYSPELYRCDGSEPNIQQVIDTFAGRNRLTQLTATGMYTGTIEANKIVGDMLSGKTIRAVDALTNATILELHGTAGTLTGYSSNGLLQSQLSRNSLSFFDDLGVPSVFLKGGDISLLDCKNGVSSSASAANNIPVGTKTVSSASFTINDKGVYKGVVPIVASGSCTTDVFRDEATDIETSISVGVTVDLEYLNGGTWETYITNVASRYFTKTSSMSVATISGDVDVPIMFTANKTGSFRLTYSHSVYGYGSAMSFETGDRYSTMVTDITSSVNNDGWVTMWHVSNGTYIGKNGLISYNSEVSERYIVFDRTDPYQFRVKADQCLYSLDEWTQLYITNEGVKIRTQGQDKFLITSNGNIKFLNFPYVALGSSGTDSARYRLYVDGNGILCRNSTSAW